MSGDKTVLLIATGGVAKKLCDFLSSHDDVGRIFMCPGGAGSNKPCVKVLYNPLDDRDGLSAFARQRRVDLVIEGADGPGVTGALRVDGSYRQVRLGTQDPLASAVWNIMRCNARIDSWTMAAPHPYPPPKQPMKVRTYECERDHKYTFQLG